MIGLPNNVFFTSKISSKNVWGQGKRSCVGKHYAIELLKILKPLVYRHDFDPTVDHLYSGRDNDNFGIFETLYQGYKLLESYFIILDIFYFLNNLT